MNTEALCKLAELLRNVPEDVFDLGDFIDLSNIDLRESWETLYDKKMDPTRLLYKCGTTACACGYAALHPWFQERGFTSDIAGRIRYVNPRVNLIDEDPVFQDWDAIIEFFQITYEEAAYLFEESSYRMCEGTPTNVAARISRFPFDRTTLKDEDDA